MTGHTIDLGTGGDWRGIYGQCFYLLPDPHSIEIEERLDPASNGLSGDPWKVDWDIRARRKRLRLVPCIPLKSDTGSRAVEPCEDNFKGATFDNGALRQTNGIFDPFIDEPARC